MSITELSLKRPVTTIMLFVSMAVIGLIAAVRLPLEALPSISFPAVFVNLPYPGSTPEEVERTVLRPAEEALSTMSGVESLRGTASSSGARLMVKYSDWDTDVQIAASEARERLDAIRDELPDDLQRYFVGNYSTDDEPILEIHLAGDTDLSRSYDLIERTFKRPLEHVDGIAKVEISGAPANEIEIAIDPDRLTAHGLSLNEQTPRLQSLNFSVAAGEIEANGNRLRVQPVGELKNLDEFRQLVINDAGVRLDDIAEIRLKPERMSGARLLDGRPSVSLEIYKEREANLVDVSRRALEELEEIRQQPELRGIEIKIDDNQGKEVTSSLLELIEAGGIGLLLSIAVLYFFLRHWPSTLMVTLAIPICFVMTLGFMYFVGVTLNVLSLMGLLLAVGMLVDNGVVVVESIYQEREKLSDHPVQGLDGSGQPIRASIVGTRNVAIALSAGTLCHCIVFLPNLFGETNDISIFMSQIAITISVSLLASWLVAVSLIPMLSARMKTPPAVRDEASLIHRLQARYARFLRWTLEHRGWSVTGIVLIILASFVPMTQTGINMFGGGVAGNEVEVYYKWNGSYTKQQMGTEVRRVEKFLNENRERFHIAQLYSMYFEQGWAETEVSFDESVEDVAALGETISKELPKSALAELGIWGAGDEGDNGSGNNVEVHLVGDSSEVLATLAEDIVPILAGNPELRDVRVDTGDQNNELTVRVDRERAAAFGFSTRDVAQFVSLALRGRQLRDFKRGETETPVWVRFKGAENYGMEDIAAFTVRAPDGRSVPLMAMVDVRVQPAAIDIHRVDRQTQLTIQANLANDATVPRAREVIEKTLDKVAFPAGYGYSFEGSAFQRNDDAESQMFFNLLIALVLIYVVMAAVFESLLFPSAIMSCVLFSIFGVFWLFWITGTEFSVMAFIGILVLMGVVVNNGIVMIEHINNLRRRGMNRTDALVDGSRERLRPILMTMGTAILAMVPIALSDTVVLGGLTYSPMARAVAGGLAFSTVVSLLFLPTIYAMLDDLRSGTARLVRRARGMTSRAATEPV